MSGIQRGKAVTETPPPDEDLAVLERLDAGEPPGSPEEAQARAPYEHLFERLRNLEDISPPAGWEDRAADRWRAARRRRRLRFALGATATVGALAAVLLLLFRPSPSLALTVVVTNDQGVPHRGDAMVGNLLQAQAQVDQAHVEVRLYRDDKLVAQCPGMPQCRVDASVIELTWKLTDPGRYKTIVFSSAEAIPPSEGRLDLDQVNANNPGVHTLEGQTIPVSR
jgi:hypothetical protein